MNVAWIPREPPLRANAVVARGEVAKRLVRKVLASSTEGLSGLSAEDMVVLLGEDLPWVDGVLYLGTDPDAPALRMPTHSTVNVPLALFEKAILARFPAPVAVWGEFLIPLGGALPLSRAALEKFLA